MQPLLRVGRLDAQVWPLIGASIDKLHVYTVTASEITKILCKYINFV